MLKRKTIDSESWKISGPNKFMFLGTSSQITIDSIIIRTQKTEVSMLVKIVPIDTFSRKLYMIVIETKPTNIELKYPPSRRTSPIGNVKLKRLKVIISSKLISPPMEIISQVVFQAKIENPRLASLITTLPNSISSSPSRSSRSIKPIVNKAKINLNFKTFSIIVVNLKLISLLN